MSKASSRSAKSASSIVRSQCIQRIQALKGNKLCLVDHLLGLVAEAPPEMINRSIHFLENALVVAKATQAQDD
jgi:hypothetical protein